MIELSPSKMRQIAECPLKYDYQCKEKVPFTQTPAATLGSNVHKFLEVVYRDPKKRLDVEGTLRMVWNATGFDSFGDSESYFARALSAVERYCEMYFTQSGEPVCGTTIGVERYLSHILEREDVEVRYTCRVDRLTRTPDNALLLVDYKTSNNGAVATAESLESDLPTFVLYGLARIKFPEYRRILIQYINVLSLKTVQVEFSPEQVAQNKKSLWSEVKKISSGDFQPKVSEACGWCGYKDRCPEMSRRSSFDDIM